MALNMGFLNVQQSFGVSITNFLKIDFALTFISQGGVRFGFIPAEAMPAALLNYICWGICITCLRK